MDFTQSINNAVSALNSKDYGLANLYLKQVIKSSKCNFNIIFEFVNSYKKLGLMSELLEIIDYTISLNISHLDLFYEKAMLHCILADKNTAVLTLLVQLKQNKNWAKGYLGLGIIYSYFAEYEIALEKFDVALKLSPNFKEALIGKGTIFLKLGKFNKGFSLYDRRLNFYKKLYHGQDLTNKTLLIRQEQGIGDIINFIPYVYKLNSINTKFIVELDKRLIPIFKRSFKKLNIKFITNIEDENYLNYDYQIPIASVLQYSIDSFNDIDRLDGYIKDENNITKAIKTKYKKYFNNKPLVGISWHTNSLFSKEQRTTSLNIWRNLLKNTNFGYISLQYGDFKNKISEFNNINNINLLYDDDINSIDDLDLWLSQIAAMDIVITIDNCTAHFAASLGKKVIVLLPLHSDWRYFTKGEDSRWYGSMQLIRQKELYDWGSVFVKLEAILEDCLIRKIVQ